MTFPTAPVEDRSAPTPRARPPAERMRVLVVDDFDDAREMYAEYLEYAGFQVDVACNGVEAVEKARFGLPDIILMDLSLPIMDGWEATRRLKQDQRTCNIPVMALSGHALAGNAEQAWQAGVDEFVAKPCLPQDLEDRIRRLLKPSRVRARP